MAGRRGGDLHRGRGPRRVRDPLGARRRRGPSDPDGHRDPLARGASSRTSSGSTRPSRCGSACGPGQVAVGTALRPQHRDRGGGQPRRAAPAGRRARGDPRRGVDRAARARGGRVRRAPPDRGQRVRHGDGLARRRAAAPGRPSPDHVREPAPRAVPAFRSVRPGGGPGARAPRDAARRARDREVPRRDGVPRPVARGHEGLVGAFESLRGGRRVLARRGDGAPRARRRPGQARRRRGTAAGRCRRVGGGRRGGCRGPPARARARAPRRPPRRARRRHSLPARRGAPGRARHARGARARGSRRRRVRRPPRGRPVAAGPDRAAREGGSARAAARRVRRAVGVPRGSAELGRRPARRRDPVGGAARAPTKLRGSRWRPAGSSAPRPSASRRTPAAIRCSSSRSRAC